MTQDLSGFIQADHRRIRKLLDELGEISGKRAKVRERLFRKLQIEVVSHMRAEEGALYGPLKRPRVATAQPDPNSDMVMEKEEEHHLVDVLLDELEHLDVSNPEWTYKFRVLRETLVRHFEDEELGLLPRLNRISAPSERAGLVESMRGTKKKYEESFRL